jgi:hypothetical protein
MIPERLPDDAVTGNSLDCFMRTIRVRLVTAHTIARTAPWFFRANDGMACFYAILCGGCRIRFDGADVSSAVGGGEIAVLPNGKGHWIQNDRQYAGRSVIFRGRFTWNSNAVASLMTELPPMIQFKGESGGFVSWMAKFVPMIADDSSIHRPGARVAMDAMASVIVVQSVFRNLRRLDRSKSQLFRDDSAAKSDSKISRV